MEEDENECRENKLGKKRNLKDSREREEQVKRENRAGDGDLKGHQVENTHSHSVVLIYIQKTCHVR